MATTGVFSLPGNLGEPFTLAGEEEGWVGLGRVVALAGLVGPLPALATPLTTLKVSFERCFEAAVASFAATGPGSDDFLAILCPGLTKPVDLVRGGTAIFPVGATVFPGGASCDSPPLSFRVADVSGFLIREGRAPDTPAAGSKLFNVVGFFTCHSKLDGALP